MSKNVMDNNKKFNFDHNSNKKANSKPETGYKENENNFKSFKSRFAAKELGKNLLN